MPGPARNRTWIQQRNAAALAPNSNRIELRGAPSAISWPPLCASCGAEAQDAITARKVFVRPRRFGHRSSPRFRGYIVTELRFPVCNDCAVRHQAEVQYPSAVSQFMRSLLTPLLIPIVGFLWLGNIVLREAMKLPPGDKGAPLVWGLVALMGAGALWTTWAVWQQSLPHRIEKQTDVALSCDFSDDVSGLFEQRRHIYSIRNPAFAQGVADFNAELLWTDEDDARSQKRRNTIFFAAIGAFALYWLYVVFAPWES